MITELESCDTAPAANSSSQSNKRDGPSSKTRGKDDGDVEAEILETDSAFSSPQETSARWGRGQVIVFHCFLSFVVCNVDRIVMSVAIIPMAKEFHWSQSVEGVVQSVFFLGYMSTPVLGGRLADRRGGRRVLALGVTLWSVMTLLIPIAAKQSFSMLLLARMLLGFGEGFAMPAMNSLVHAWVPCQYLSRSLGIIYSGMHAGSILGLLTTPNIIRAYGWMSAFYVFGIAGLFWVSLFLLTTTEGISSNLDAADDYELLPDIARVDDQCRATRENPTESRESTPCFDNGSSEQEELTGTTANAIVVNSHSLDLRSDSTSCTPSIRDMLSKKPVWAIIFAHFCCTWGYFILLMWLPSFLTSRFEQDIRRSAYLSALPWITMFLFTNASGFIADALISRGLGVTLVRKIMQSVGFLGPALCLILLAMTYNLPVAVALIVMGLGFSGFSQSGVYCNHQDISGRSNCAGTLLGISNTVASVPGVIGVGVTGFILDWTNENWGAVFATAIFFYLSGAIVYCTFGSSEPLF